MRVSSALAALAVLATTLPAAALDRRVQVGNATGVTIVALYGSNTGTDDWEEDVLGDAVLPGGSTVVVDWDDASGYCQFDLRADFEDGDSVVQRRVNVCEVGSVTFE